MSTDQSPLLPQQQQLHRPPPPKTSAIQTTRRHTKSFLTSRYGHYTVLALVSLDVSSIFAELLIQLLTCEGRIAQKPGRHAEEALSIISIVFSSLFMLELLASIWAFGLAFFHTPFHIFDATVITTSFIIDVLLKNLGESVLEEIGSLVIVLRLWRVFKIIEELSAGAEEQIEPLQEKIEDLESQNEGLRRRVEGLKKEVLQQSERREGRV